MPSDRARSAATLLAIVVVILLGQATWQEVRVHALRSQLEESRRRFDEEVAKAATERLRAHRAEILQTQEWLHDFYASPEGLQRRTACGATIASSRTSKPSAPGCSMSI